MRIHSLRHPADELTPRQREVMSLIAKGRTNPEIATELGMTIDGAKWHVREILGKLGVDSREEAVREWRARRNGALRLAIVLGGLAASAAAVVVGVALWVAFSGRSAPSATPLASATAVIPASTTVSTGSFTADDAIAKLPEKQGDRTLQPEGVYDGQLLVSSVLAEWSTPPRGQVPPRWDTKFMLWDPATGKFAPLWDEDSKYLGQVLAVHGDWAAVLDATGTSNEFWKFEIRNLKTGEVRTIAANEDPLGNGLVEFDPHVWFAGDWLIFDTTRYLTPAPTPTVAGPALGLVPGSTLPATVAPQEINPITYEYNIATGQMSTLAGHPIRALPSHPDEVPDDSPTTMLQARAAAVRPGAALGQSDASGGLTVGIYDPETKASTPVLRGKGITSVQLNSDGRYLAWIDAQGFHVLDRSTGARFDSKKVGWQARLVVDGDVISWYPGSGSQRLGYYDAANGTFALAQVPAGTSSDDGLAMGKWFVWQIMDNGPTSTSADGYWAIIPIG